MVRVMPLPALEPLLTCILVSTEGVDRETADEWIERAIDEAEENRIEVVTADRRLRSVAHGARAKTINPAKFWRRYLPRLKGLKTDYSNQPKDTAA